MKLRDDFKDFLSLLNRDKIRYLVIGAHAVGYHGYPRTTKVLDVWIATDSKNIDSFISVLTEFGFNDPFLEQWKKQPRKTLRMGYPPFRIEVLTEISGIDFETAYPNRIHGSIDKVPATIIALKDLKTNKKAAGRLQDLDDIKKLP